jgi:hypothetical protein
MKAVLKKMMDPEEFLSEYGGQFAELAVSHIINRALEDLNMKLPKPTVNISDIRRQYHQAEVVAKAS